LLIASPLITSAHAADQEQPATNSEPLATRLSAVGNGWVFQATLSGWGDGLTGNLRMTPPHPAVHVNLPLKTIIQHLDGALMGSFKAKYGLPPLGNK